MVLSSIGEFPRARSEEKMKMKRKYVLFLAAALILCLAALFALTGRKVRASQAEDSVIQPAAVVLAVRRPEQRRRAE